MEVITTDQCEHCVYGSVNEISKAEMYVHCQRKDKTYFFGQCVPCDDFRKEER